MGMKYTNLPTQSCPLPPPQAWGVITEREREGREGLLESEGLFPKKKEMHIYLLFELKFDIALQDYLKSRYIISRQRSTCGTPVILAKYTVIRQRSTCGTLYL
jgi:hypothetical protein